MSQMKDAPATTSGLNDPVLTKLLAGRKKEEKKLPFQLKLPSIGNLEEAKKAMRLQAERQIEIQKNVPNAEEFVTHVLGFISDVERLAEVHGDEILKGPYNEDGREITVGEKVEQLDHEIQELFDHEESAIRMAAHLAYLRFELRPQEMDRGSLFSLIEKFVEEGYFEENLQGSGSIRVWKKSFSLSSSTRFGGMKENEETQIGRLVAAHVKRIQEEYVEEIRTDEEKLAKQITSDFTVMDLWEGKEGTCLMEVPKGTMLWRDFDAGTEKERYLPGGKILISVNGDGIQIQGATGGIKRQATQIKQVENETRRKITIPLKEFRTSEGELVDKDDSPQPNASYKLRSWKAKYRAAWFLLHRGFELALKRAKGHEIRSRLQKQADLSPKEFLLEEKDGTVWLEFRQSWIDGEKIKFYDHPGVLVRRFRGPEDERRIRLLGCLPQHEAYFEACMTISNGFSEGDRFQGLDYPLGKFLRAIWKVVKTAEVREQRERAWNEEPAATQE